MGQPELQCNASFKLQDDKQQNETKQESHVMEVESVLAAIRGEQEARRHGEGLMIGR